MADDTTTRSPARRTTKGTARKTTTRKAPAKKPAARRTTRTAAKAKASDHRVRNRTVAALGVVSAAAAGVGWAFSMGLLDRFLPKHDAEHRAPDLAAGKDVHDGRAPDAFRPDPTAPVPASEREALRPATGPSPTLVADRGEMNSQTAPALADA